jgi:hypothetical protein
MEKPDKRYRSKNGEIFKKHGSTLIRTLRQKYGAAFAPGISDDVRLASVLHMIAEPSLRQLVRDLENK